MRTLYQKDEVKIVVVDNDSPRDKSEAIERVVDSSNTVVVRARPSGFELGALQIAASLGMKCKVPPQFTTLLQYSTPMTRSVDFENEMACGMMRWSPEKHGGWGPGYIGESQKKQKGVPFEPKFKGGNGSFVGVLFNRSTAESSRAF